MKKVFLVLGVFFLVLLSNTGCQMEKSSKELYETSYFEETDAPEQHVSGDIQYSFSEDGVLTIQGEGEIREKDFDEVIFRDIKKIIIKEGITGIGEECFSYCSRLVSVKLPESLYTIGQGAFGECVNLKKINIPEKVAQIGKGAFYGCFALKKVVLPEELIKVEDKTFAACHSLEEIILPDGLKEIGKKAFAGCYSLKTLILPKALVNYAPSAIKNCKGIEKIKNLSSYDWELCTDGVAGSWYCEGKKVGCLPAGRTAKIHSDEYRLIYDLNGGQETEKLPAVYKSREGIEIPDTVKREGYSLFSWYIGTEESEGWDGALRHVIDKGETGNWQITAIWYNMLITAGKGRLQASYHLVTKKEPPSLKVALYPVFRYGKREDMSDCDYINTTGNEEKNRKIEIKGLARNEQYWIEYAFIEDMDDWESLDALPWQGKKDFIIK